MADSFWDKGVDSPPTAGVLRHSVAVRISHWLNLLCFLALLVSGVEILISHPRFYWGEAGNVNTKPLFQIPIPSSRAIVPTGYGYVLPDQNGWSRALHFQGAWMLLFLSAAYLGYSFFSGHLKRDLAPRAADLAPGVVMDSIRKHARFDLEEEKRATSYNVLQRLSYLKVLFVLFPLMIWSGLAMSPAFAAAVPAAVAALGGHQSARTIHFFVTISLLLFVLVHVLMVYLTGFRRRLRAMTIGGGSAIEEQA
ncbi:MAG: cytochrome b/b6 domain-containing protein [Acidobacteria bacterium]|nr:cytochrome b/b6 domain-containing protein [Acidobacteriota bacterium]